ncbi:MAG: helix-turn-helix domain-containing protein [Acidimicrobiales bacterium]
MDAAIRRVMTSLDEFLDPVATASMVPMVLQPGPMRAEVVTMKVRGVIVSMSDYSFAVASHGESLAGRIAMASPARRVASGRMNGQPMSPAVVHGFGASAEVAGSVVGPAVVASISLLPEDLERSATALGVEIDLPGAGEYRAVPAPDAQSLHQLLRRVTQSVRVSGRAVSSPGEAAAFADAVLSFGVHCFAADGGHATLTSTARLNSVHIARACEEYAAASRYQNVTLVDLCRASGASERRVRHAFYECYGMSPTAYLRTAALYQVRRALLVGPEARDAVSRVASGLGFWHLSRFAGQYRALFGELPSATSRRSLERRAG